MVKDDRMPRSVRRFTFLKKCADGVAHCLFFFLGSVVATLSYLVFATIFVQVAQSMANGLEEGQYLEYAYPPEGTKKRFWYVELLYAQGPEVFVRYLGLEDYP